MEENRIRDIDAFIEEHAGDLKRDMARLVAVNSVESAAEPDAPFGRGAKQALDLGLEIARELGLKAVNCANRIGYAEIGEGEDYLATITHLDVVPVGEGWTGDPFTLRERDGWLIGRGILDDKGPSVVCLYALKYLQDRGIELRYPVRAILGCNEETGMGDVEYYLAHVKPPVFLFSPDSDFPVCNGEKGITRGRIVSRMPLGNVVGIRGGVAANVIPAKCEAWVKGEKPEASEDVSVEADGDLWHLTAKGIGGHASKPAGTKNAIGVLVSFLLERCRLTAEEEEFFRLLALLHSASDGSGVGTAADDGRFDPLTIIGGVIGVEGGHIYQVYDSRYPTNTSGDKIAAAIREKAGDTAEIVVETDNVPFYMDPENPAVKTCLDVYNAVTGEDAKPYTMGGGTYARHFPNGVAFGPEHPERPAPDFAGPIHGADEAACFDWFKEALKIYILALIELEKLDF